MLIIHLKVSFGLHGLSVCWLCAASWLVACTACGSGVFVFCWFASGPVGCSGCSTSGPSGFSGSVAALLAMGETAGSRIRISDF